MVDSREHVKELIEDLSSDSRRQRQNAALELSDHCTKDASSILPFGQALVEALELSETRTRWAVLEALTKLSSYDLELCERALPGVENALFDETSGPLHLASFRFLCSFGAQSPDASDKVWPLLDEAIQCFHGDQEFLDMLDVLVEFSGGALSEETKKGFTERMLFDAQNNKGLIQRRAQTIVANLSN